MALTEKQMEERLNYIGASESAAVLGLSRWSTPLKIWAEKTKQIPQSEEESLPMWVGSELEEVVAKRFMLETGKKVHRVNETLFHKKYPFLACHLDRKVEGENAILQCKTASAFKYREWEDEIPQEYIVQEFHELACSGYKKAYIACLIGNHKFVIKEIQRDEKVIRDMVKKEVAFWNDFVVKKIMPGDITAKDGDILYQLFPRAEAGKEIELADTANAICESIDSLKADGRVIKKQVDEQESELKAMLKEHEAGTTGRYRITWKNQTQNRIDVQRFKEENLELYVEYLKETKFRKLNIGQVKGKEVAR